ncbi:MAG: hypothetical protein HOA23_09515 [Gemmatimonadales bacterium]|nr:hypothetical protein [Gemmatimonadales bacterium]
MKSKMSERWVGVAAGMAAIVTLAWSGIVVVTSRPSAPGSGDDTQTQTAPVGSAEGRVYETILGATDADAFGDDWYVLDARSNLVHHLAVDGTLVDSFGGEGRGPGEMQGPEAIVIHHDTVVVAESMGGVVHLYGLDGSFIADRRIGAEDCAISVVIDLVTTPAGLAVLLGCFDHPMAPSAKVVLEREGSTSVLADLSAQHSDRGVDPFFSPVVAAHLGGVLAGVAGSDCLAVYDFFGSVSEEICHEWISRVVPSEADQQALEVLSAQATAMGFDLDAYDRLPGFDRVFVDAAGRVVYRGVAGGTPEQFRAVTERPTGQEEALPIPLAEYLFVRGDRVLLGWDELDGTRLSLRSWRRQ